MRNKKYLLIASHIPEDLIVALKRFVTKTKGVICNKSKYRLKKRGNGSLELWYRYNKSLKLFTLFDRSLVFALLKINILQ